MLLERQGLGYQSQGAGKPRLQHKGLAPADLQRGGFGASERGGGVRGIRRRWPEKKPPSPSLYARQPQQMLPLGAATSSPCLARCRFWGHWEGRAAERHGALGGAPPSYRVQEVEQRPPGGVPAAGSGHSTPDFWRRAAVPQLPVHSSAGRRRRPPELLQGERPLIEGGRVLLHGCAGVTGVGRLALGAFCCLHDALVPGLWVLGP